MPKIDLAGAELLSELQRTFRAQDIAFRLAEAHGEVRDALRRVDFEQEYGAAESGQSVHFVGVSVDGPGNTTREQEISKWLGLAAVREEPPPALAAWVNARADVNGGSIGAPEERAAAQILSPSIEGR